MGYWIKCKTNWETDSCLKLINCSFTSFRWFLSTNNSDFWSSNLWSLIKFLCFTFLLTLLLKIGKFRQPQTHVHIIEYFDWFLINGFDQTNFSCPYDELMPRLDLFDLTEISSWCTGRSLYLDEFVLSSFFLWNPCLVSPKESNNWILCKNAIKRILWKAMHTHCH